MNILKSKQEISKSKLLLRYLCSFASIATLMNTSVIHQANAQSIDPSLATCTLTTQTANIDLGDVNPITTPQVVIGRNLRIQCNTRGYFGPNGSGSYVPRVNACIGIRSLDGTDEGARNKRLYRQKTAAEGGGVDLNNSLGFEIYLRAPGGVAVTAPIGTGLPGGGQPINIGIDGVTFSGPVPPLVGIDVAANSAIGMRLLEPPILNIPVGTYSNTFQYSLYGGVATPNGGLQAGTTPDSSNGCHSSYGQPSLINFTVTARVVAGCSVSISHINFGEHINIPRDLEMEGAVNLRCNVNAPYEIQINGGKSGDINARKMYLIGANGVEDRSKSIPYHIYLPNTQTEWGVTKGTNSYEGITSANDTSIKVKAVIRAAEAVNPATGTYKDTLVVTTIY